MDEKNEKRSLELDWEKLLPSRNDDVEEPPLPVLIITKNDEQTESMTTAMECGEEMKCMSDEMIEEKISNISKQITVLGPKLKDNGDKLKARKRVFEEELERRRKRRREEEDDNITEKPIQGNDSSFTGSSNVLKQKSPSTRAQSQSIFASRFTEKMEEDRCGRTVNPFHKEMSLLGRCDKRKMKRNGQSSPKRRQNMRSLPFRCPRSLSHDSDKDQNILVDDDDRIGRDSSTCPLSQSEESFLTCRDKTGTQTSNDLKPRKGETIVLLDEEDPQLVQKADKLPECFKDATIYYPSRDDPESVEISYSDTECLAPETFLTSTIMNFYIRFLQQPTCLTDKPRCDYHCFNTYFYEKLKEAVSYKGNDKGPFFKKFRRWWKGVNIFQKAYILFPIHEDLHWSLVIICMLDKEAESGPIILHLDSLRLHNSRKIFDNVKSFIRQEYDYTSQEVAQSDLPVSDRIWKNLPRRIDDKIIAVPQQKNDYDCGLFVLFFMERFIEEAPERLKKKDLVMFGKQWFRPEEASNLRGKIRDILLKEFQRATRGLV